MGRRWPSCFRTRSSKIRKEGGSSSSRKTMGSEQGNDINNVIEIEASRETVGSRQENSFNNSNDIAASRETMGGQQGNAVSNGDDIEIDREITVLDGDYITENIVENHDFSKGLQSWKPNCCDGFVVSGKSASYDGIDANSGENFVVISNRTECWQGLEQDITSQISVGSTYTLSAHVRVWGHSLQGSTGVQATLKLEYTDSDTTYLPVGRTLASKERWERLNGKFILERMPHKAIFYLEGPPPGVDILIDTVVVSSTSAKTVKEIDRETTVPERGYVPENIIENHDFSGGLQSWKPNSCNGYVVCGESAPYDGIKANSGENFVVISNRTECWQGLEQDITNRISVGSTYDVSVLVRVWGPSLQGSTGVQATLKLEYTDSDTAYLFVGRTTASKERWERLVGKFVLEKVPHKAIFYLEGPSPDVDILIDSVIVSSSSVEVIKDSKSNCFDGEGVNIILNPNFEDGLTNWSGRSCKIALHDSMGDGKILPLKGKFFASATERSQNWNGIQQDISGRVERKLAYEVNAVVRVFGSSNPVDVRATLWVKNQNQREQYIGIASVQATDKDWVQLQGKFLLNGNASKVAIYLEGPPAGTDILLNSLVVKHASKVPPSPPPNNENALYGFNIIQNSNLSNSLTGWFPLGNCNLSSATGSPIVLPSMAIGSLGPHEPLSGHYILVTNRTQNWMGPAQMITDKIELYLTYQVSAWVRVSSTSNGPQNVNVAVSVDGRWVNGGQVEIGDDRWHEIGGSFRIEVQPSKVMIYIQGPSPGVDLMVAGLQVFPVDRHARFRHLKIQTDKVRKRDVTLKFSGPGASDLTGRFVRVQQIQNSFGFGSCISRSNIDNEDFVSFLVKNFNWAVFGNELKWYWTEAQQGKFNYTDADELLDLCNSNNLQVRGHCIFWEVESAVQSWVKSLNQSDLMTAVQNRLNGLLTRYKGKFKHYDVNNEMLHGSFFKDRLGKDIRANMFKTARQLDDTAILFVNDYHVEDACDIRSSPEKYIEHILDLQEQGAQVGGIGIQGHIDCPVGPIVCSALDKLGILGLPIWFTEVDVSSANEYVRADDLEVMLREAFAHPAVEGIVLWGFWELFMSRNNAHLVDAEGTVNEAGKRYLALKQEWLSHARGHLDDKGQFGFRGYHGTYTFNIAGQGKKLAQTFVVDKGEGPLVIDINLQ